MQRELLCFFFVTILAMPLLVRCGNTGSQPNNDGRGGGASGIGVCSESDMVYNGFVGLKMALQCNHCHRPGYVETYDFSTYEKVYDQRALIRNALSAQTMPAGLANTYANDNVDSSLYIQPAEAQKIIEWIDAGAPKGSLEGCSNLVYGERSLARVDFSGVTASYTAAAGTSAVVTQEIAMPQLTANKYIVGFEIKPKIRNIISSVQLFYELPGAPTIAGQKVPYVTWQLVGMWGPTSGAQMLPTGTGFKLVPGTKLIVSTAYNTTPEFAGPLPTVPANAVVIELMLADSALDAYQMPIFNPNWIKDSSNYLAMTIAAGDANASATSGPQDPFDLKVTIQKSGVTKTIDFSAPIRGKSKIKVYQDIPTMKIFGKRLEMHTVKTSGGATSQFLTIPLFEYFYQVMYAFKTPFPVVNGQDKVKVTCHWDNSQANQPYVNGVQKTSAAMEFNFSDPGELCIGLLYITAE